MLISVQVCLILILRLWFDIRVWTRMGKSNISLIKVNFVYISNRFIPSVHLPSGKCKKHVERCEFAPDLNQPSSTWAMLRQEQIKSISSMSASVFLVCIKLAACKSFCRAGCFSLLWLLAKLWSPSQCCSFCILCLSTHQIEYHWIEIITSYNWYKYFRFKNNGTLITWYQYSA